MKKLMHSRASFSDFVGATSGAPRANGLNQRACDGPLLDVEFDATLAKAMSASK